MLKGLGPLRNLRRLRGGSAAARPVPVAAPAAWCGVGAERLRGVDAEALLSLARQSFVRLQAAWDEGDERSLAAIATAPLMDDLRAQLRQRGPGVNRTEVLEVEANLLALEELHEAYVASVEFSGLIRERSDGVASPFRELWLLANPKLPEPGWSGWRLAGVQSLC